MNAFKENANSIALCLFELIVGILLLINPIGFTSGIITITGLVLMAFGIIEIVKYFKESLVEAAIGQTLVKGLVFILAGGFCTFKTEWFVRTFPVLTIIYGIVILLTGISKVQLTVDMLRRKNKKWFWAAINAVISIICAIVILNSPFTSTAVLWSFTGITMIFEGVLDVITMIIKKNEEGNNE